MKDNSIFESDSESVGYKEKQDEKKRALKKGISTSLRKSLFLKQFKLKTWRFGLLWLSTEKQFDVAKLLVCDA